MKISVLAVAFLGVASGHEIREESKTVRGADGAKIEGKKICGAIDLRNAQCYKDSEPTIYNAAKAVIAMKSNYLCTGWLVGPNNYMMTNNHCISSQAEADGWDYHFMYESANGSCQQGGVKDTDVTSAKVISGAQLIWTDKALDATLLKLPENVVSEFGYYDISDQAPVVGHHIYIPQHPKGRDKSIGITDSYTNSGMCEIERLHDDQYGHNVYYTCDTEGGSSGSPVVDKNNPKMAIALHKAGLEGCHHGNWGTPMNLIYPKVKEWVYGGSAPTGTPPTGSPPTGGCTDLAGWTDSYGDGCQYYKDTSGACDTYGDDQGTDGKTPKDACCTCGGGSSGSSTSGTGSSTGGGCTDLAGWTDSYGDGCQYYKDTDGACDTYGNDQGTNGKTPKDACCVCK